MVYIKKMCDIKRRRVLFFVENNRDRCKKTIGHGRQTHWLADWLTAEEQSIDKIVYIKLNYWLPMWLIKFRFLLIIMILHLLCITNFIDNAIYDLDEMCLRTHFKSHLRWYSAKIRSDYYKKVRAIFWNSSHQSATEIRIGLFESHFD